MTAPRRSPRKVADQIVSIDMEPNNHAIVLNFSENGLGFRAIYPVTQLGTIHFWFWDNGERVQASGQLVWTDPSQKSGGLQFVSMPQAVHERLQAWASQSGAFSGSAAPTQPRPQPPIEPSPATLRPPAPNAAPSSFAPPPAPLPPVEPPPTTYRPPEASAAPSAYAPRMETPRMQTPRMQTPWNQPPSPSFALMQDDPDYMRYAAEIAHPSSGGKFFSGFVTGAIVTAILALILVSTYGDSVGALLAQGRAAIGIGPQPTAAAPVPPPAPLAPAPQPSSVAPPVAETVPPASSASPSASDLEPQAVPPLASNPDTSAAVPPVNAPPVSKSLDGRFFPERPAQSRESAAGRAAGVSNNPADNGGEDLALARRYLNDKAGTGYHAEAVRPLWSAIQKGNVEAEIMLADLYARGDGVTKNCNQARVLLRAAAERGNSEASQKLATVVRMGCR